MNKTLFSLLFFFCAISSKIIIFDEADLKDVLKSLENGKLSKSSRKLEEADTGVADVNEDTEADNASEVNVDSDSSEENESDLTEEDESEEESEDPLDDQSLPPFIPKSCYYRGNRRPGFEVDGQENPLTFTPSGVKTCEDPQDYVVAKEVLSTEDLSTCKGLDYTYTKNGKEMTVTLYPMRNSGSEEGLPEIHPGYFNKQTGFAELWMYGAEYNYRSWMGEIYVLCLE